MKFFFPAVRDDGDVVFTIVLSNCNWILSHIAFMLKILSSRKHVISFSYSLRISAWFFLMSVEALLMGLKSEYFRATSHKDEHNFFSNNYVLLLQKMLFSSSDGINFCLKVLNRSKSYPITVVMSWFVQPNCSAGWSNTLVLNTA